MIQLNLLERRYYGATSFSVFRFFIHKTLSSQMWELFAGVKLDSLHRSGVKWDASQFGHLKGGKTHFGNWEHALEIHMCICMYANATSIWRLPLQLSGKLIKLLIDWVLFPRFLGSKPVSYFTVCLASLVKNKSDSIYSPVATRHF